MPPGVAELTIEMTFLPTDPAIPHHHRNRAKKHRDDNERQHASRDAVAKINDGGAITLVFTIGALCLLGTIMLCL